MFVKFYSFTNPIHSINFLTYCLTELGYPVFNNCPSAIFVETDPGDNKAVVTWAEIAATDEFDIPAITSNYNSGSSFSVGTTTVIYTATDSDGLSSTCSFDVSVSGKWDISLIIAHMV